RHLLKGDPARTPPCAPERQHFHCLQFAVIGIIPSRLPIVTVRHSLSKGRRGTAQTHGTLGTLFPPRATGEADGNLTDYLCQIRAKIEAHLRSVLRPHPGLPAALLEAMRYSLLAPGKRLRPLLVVMAAEACGATTPAALPAASAVEMVHTYS